MEEIGKTFLFLGGVLLLVGLVLTYSDRIPWIGKLPGDFYWKKGDVHIYFPLATGLLLSLALSILSLLYHYWRGDR